MFKIIIIDLAQLVPKTRNIYLLFSEITKFKGSAKKIEELLKSDYENLITGGINEESFWKKLKEVTKTKRMTNSLKLDFFSKLKTSVNRDMLDKIRENFKIAVIGDFLENWWREIKRKNKISADYELFSNNTKSVISNYSFFEHLQTYFNISIHDSVFVSDNIESITTAKMIGSEIVYISNKKIPEANFTYSSLNHFAEVIA